MAQKPLIPTKTTSETPTRVIRFSVGPDFVDTFKAFKKAGMGDRITKALDKFKTLKQQNPTQPYGGSDKPFSGEGHFHGLSHAHLTHNISLVYRYVGAQSEFKLYGLYTHDDLGTGTPANMRKQSTMGMRLKGQMFEHT